MVLTHSLTPYLTEQSELVVWKKAICFVEKEISPDELFEAPVFPLDESIGSLAFCKGRKKKNQSGLNFFIINYFNKTERH